MAVQRSTRSNIRDTSEPVDPLLERALTTLAQRGAEPDGTGAYTDADLIAALRDRGWGIDEWSQTGSIEVRVIDLSDPSSHVVIESDGTRPLLLEVLRRSMSWLTADEDECGFDAETRSLLGLSSDEFRHQWHNGCLDYDDPIVEHLGVTLLRGR